MKKLSLIILIFFIISLSACSNQSAELASLKAENERLKSELAGQEHQKSTESTYQTATTTENKPAITQNNSSTSSYELRRKEFADAIKQALNAPGLPEMCTDAYFNSKGELIIEVNGEWLVLDKELKKDMIYALTELLKKSKKNLNVEGYGQFFSDAGRPLESFYAK